MTMLNDSRVETVIGCNLKKRFHRLVPAEANVHLHIDNLAAQTGVTRFTQLYDHWRYSKNESLSSDQLQIYTHLLIEARSKYSTNLKPFAKTHTVLDAVEGFSQVLINYKLIPPVKIKTKPSIFILERKNWMDSPSIQNSISVQDSNESDEMKTNILEQFDEDVINVNHDHIPTEVSDSSETYQNEIGESLDPSQEITNDKELRDVDKQMHANTNNLDLPDNNLFEAEIINNVNLELQEEKPNRFLMKAKAVEKIKAVTKNHVLASAKEKLKRFIKDRKTRATEQEGEKITLETVEAVEVVEPTDLPTVEDVDLHIEESVDEAILIKDNNLVESVNNENVLDANVEPKSISVDVIVEEVIAKLVERKLLDEKRSLRAEERELIQQIVEEVLKERLRDRSLLKQDDPQVLVQ